MATAGLSDATAQGRKLTPEQLRQILAMRQSQQQVGTPSPGGMTYWSDPSQTYDKATDTHGFMVGREHGWNRVGEGNASSEVLDPSKDQDYIMQVRAGTGGKLGDRWDTQGNYLGTYEAQDGGGRQFNQAAMMFGSALGGMYAQGLQGAKATFTANDVAMMAANGMTDAQIAVAVGPEAASGLGLAGPGTGMTFAEATTLAAQQAGTPGLNNVGNGLQEPATPPADPATPPPADAAAKAAADAAAKAAAEKAATGAALTAAEKALLDAAIKAGTIVATTAVTKALADEVVDSSTTDDAKFSKMFDAMFADYQKMSARGDDMWNNYLTTFRPLEQKFAASAAGFDTPTRRETAANDATGQVASEYDQQRQTAQRNMISAGVDPSTMYALDQSSRIVQAKDQAQAANKARSDTELQGLSLVKSAADFGRGISTGATQLQQVGQTGANAATNNATGLANVQTQNTNSRNALYSDLFGAIGTGLGAWAANYNKGP